MLSWTGLVKRGLHKYQISFLSLLVSFYHIDVCITWMCPGQTNQMTTLTKLCTNQIKMKLKTENKQDDPGLTLVLIFNTKILMDAVTGKITHM